METIAKTEYQDVYRVTDGVLLVVNKFVKMFPNSYGLIYDKGQGRRKKYHTNTKDLYILQKDYEDEYGQFPDKILKGTVTYYSRPVVATDNQSDWTYQLKTTGICFSGNVYEFDSILSSILYTVRTGEIRK